MDWGRPLASFARISRRCFEVRLDLAPGTRCGTGGFGVVTSRMKNGDISGSVGAEGDGWKLGLTGGGLETIVC